MKYAVPARDVVLMLKKRIVGYRLYSLYFKYTPFRFVFTIYVKWLILLSKPS